MLITIIILVLSAVFFVECRQGQKRRRPVPARIRTVCYADSRLVI
jgi:hypothetical protein